MAKTIRFLLSRDDWYHQRGYWVIAKTLRNAGIEVVLGGTQTPEDVVNTAIQEGVDIIGYRIMDAAPKIVVPILLEKMKQEGAQDIPVVVGGIVPKKEEKLIREMGIKEVFHPYSPLESVVERIRGLAAEARKQGVA
ncbi:MAG: cobalamin-dependent protein [Deltaproteobacteria bacterium]|nr:cobalamin-dependent protein [Deltaproteobacteria bacterium]MBW1815586.1 cobalamin-dependent protein [Deltaproteobacteria bacterium]